MTDCDCEGALRKLREALPGGGWMAVVPSPAATVGPEPAGRLSLPEDAVPPRGTDLDRIGDLLRILIREVRSLREALDR